MLNPSHDEAFIRRIRRDLSHPNGLTFWCVSDNLRKGTAANAVQIAELLAKHKGWEEFCDTNGFNKWVGKMAAGHIYVLQNAAFPDLKKIGKTTRTPEERAAELSRHSGVPQPFRVVFSLLVADCDEAERVVHNSLASRRANDDREFFLISIDDAVHTIKLHCIGVVVGTAAGRLSQTVTYSDPIRMPSVSTGDLPNEQENQNELPVLTTDDARIRPGDDVANRETLIGCLILISALVAGLFFFVRWVAS